MITYKIDIFDTNNPDKQLLDSEEYIRSTLKTNTKVYMSLLVIFIKDDDTIEKYINSCSYGILNDVGIENFLEKSREHINNTISSWTSVKGPGFTADEVLEHTLIESEYRPF